MSYKQVLVLNEKTHNEAKNDTTGLYLHGTVDSFEDYVNFELQILGDSDNKKVESVHPMDDGEKFVIVYTLKS